MDDHELRHIAEERLLTYCRGIDRLDPGIVAAPFHPGALLIDYAPTPVPIEAFVERAVVSLGERFVATQHRATNLLLERLAPDVARYEAYMLAFHLEDGDEGRRLHTFNGRYVDRLEERDGVWKIAQRHLRVDWSTITPADETMTGEETWVRSGRAGAPDPIFE